MLSTRTLLKWNRLPRSTVLRSCGKTGKTCTGGRPKKTKMNRRRPLSFTTRTMRDAPNSMKSSIPLQPSRFLLTTFVAIEDLQCSICNYIVDQPVETPCRKLVCLLCIIRLFRSCDDVASLLCPSSVESDIHQFLSHYHTTFPRATVMPKLHVWKIIWSISSTSGGLEFGCLVNKERRASIPHSTN